MTNWKDRLHSIFPKTNGKIAYDSEESISFSTPWVQSEQICKMISFLCPGINTIIESCGGLGSDTITFSKHFRDIRTCELDPVRFKALEYNVHELYKCDNVKLFNEDFVKWVVKNGVGSAAVYIDLPWGGRDYDKDENINETMSIGGKKINELVDIVSKAKIIVFKVPINNTVIEDTYKTYYSYRKKNAKYHFITNTEKLK
jgi:hypothetical protein